MKPFKILFTVIATALLFASCEKDKNELPVDFKFVLLDTLGNEKTVFNQGENIIFSFQVINNSSEDLYLENFLPNNDFFKVFQPNTDEGLLSYGYPYDIICEIGAFHVPKNNLLEIKSPWTNSENNTHYFYCLLADKELHKDFLPTGNFYSEFTQSFKIGGIQTEEKHFKINFTIQ
jgi:hypothetical protein